MKGGLEAYQGEYDGKVVCCQWLPQQSLGGQTKDHGNSSQEAEGG